VSRWPAADRHRGSGRPGQERDRNQASRTVATAVTNPRLRSIAVLVGLAACGGGPWQLV